MRRRSAVRVLSAKSSRVASSSAWTRAELRAGVGFAHGEARRAEREELEADVRDRRRRGSRRVRRPATQVERHHRRRLGDRPSGAPRARRRRAAPRRRRRRGAPPSNRWCRGENHDERRHALHGERRRCATRAPPVAARGDEERDRETRRTRRTNATALPVEGRPSRRHATLRGSPATTHTTNPPPTRSRPDCRVAISIAAHSVRAPRSGRHGPKVTRRIDTPLGRPAHVQRCAGGRTMGACRSSCQTCSPSTSPPGVARAPRSSGSRSSRRRAAVASARRLGLRRRRGDCSR